MKPGILLAIMAYIFWGVLPIYWKTIQHVSSFEILCHRVVWAFLFLSIIQTVTRNWRGFQKKLKSSKTRLMFFGTACIIGFNWFLYVWTVNSGFIIEASLGYFINPLLNVLLGVIILRERLRLYQWIAVGVATLGVLYMTFLYGAFPWIALLLALTFGVYGLFRKIGSLDAVEGLTFETGVLFIPSLICLVMWEMKGTGSFGHASFQTTLSLFATGIVTSLPLMLFAAAARRIPLSLVGILQYILPTMLFIMGVFVFKENFSTTRLIGFLFIWLSLAIYTVETMVFRKKTMTKQAIVSGR